MRALLRRARAGATARLDREERDAGAALLTVLLFILLLAVLSVVVLGSLISQVRPTAFTQDSSRSLFAAEAGVQATLGQVRTAVKTVGPDTFGDRSRLPCTLAGTVGEAGQALTYDVKITYFTDDPAGQDAAWRKTNAKACSPSGGTSLTPAFAIITSTGRADSDTTGKAYRSAGPRTLESKYTFKLTNKNIAGGLMYTVRQLACLEAESATVGSKVFFQTKSKCISGTPTQMWVYDKDYAIKLAVTTGTTTGVGSTGTTSELCLTDPDVRNGGTVTLQMCVTGQVDQLWSYEGGAHFRGQNSDNSNYANSTNNPDKKNVCLAANNRQSDPSAVAKNYLTGSSYCGNNEDWGSFSPEPRVGAGAAAKATSQIVNYLEFGRCTDVTGGKIGNAFMISYPCKQDPSGGTKLNWNHKWYYSGAGEPASPGVTTIKVFVNDTTPYCLTLPGPGVKDNSVTFKSCDNQDHQKFVRTYDSGAYATSYTFTTTETVPRCLSLGPPKPDDGVNWSTIVAASCTGGAEQKWNAPPNALTASLSDTRELPTTGAGG